MAERCLSQLKSRGGHIPTNIYWTFILSIHSPLSLTPSAFIMSNTVHVINLLPRWFSGFSVSQANFLWHIQPTWPPSDISSIIDYKLVFELIVFNFSNVARVLVAIPVIIQHYPFVALDLNVYHNHQLIESSVWHVSIFIDGRPLLLSGLVLNKPHYQLACFFYLLFLSYECKGIWAFLLYYDAVHVWSVLLA